MKTVYLYLETHTHVTQSIRICIWIIKNLHTNKQIPLCSFARTNRIIRNTDSPYYPGKKGYIAYISNCSWKLKQQTMFSVRVSISWHWVVSSLPAKLCSIICKNNKRMNTFGEKFLFTYFHLKWNNSRIVQCLDRLNCEFTPKKNWTF